MKSSPIMPRLLRTKDAAHYLAISAGNLRRLAQDGKIPHIAEENSCAWRFDRADLDNYIDANKTTDV